MRGMRIWAGMVACVWALVGCGAEAETPATDAPEPTEQHTLAQFRIGVDLELADAASQAVALWNDATDGAYAPELVIGGQGRFQITLTEIPECADALDAWGCTDATGIRISSDVPESALVWVIAHEIGHSLWLKHRDDGSLMDVIHATPASRAEPCVSADLVASTGMVGTGTCL